MKRRASRVCLILGLIGSGNLAFNARICAQNPLFGTVNSQKLTTLQPPQGLRLDAPQAMPHRLTAPVFLHNLDLTRPAMLNSIGGYRMDSVGTIGKMEAAFFCADTPFVDQVNLPIAAVWGGRIKLRTFESDVTTANFVLGLPGAGALHSLSMFGSGHLAMHTPPSDQLFGMHVTLNLRDREVGEGDNSGLRGIQYVVHAGREFLQSFGIKAPHGI
jgi:hypothetical protein